MSTTAKSENQDGHKACQEAKREVTIADPSEVLSATYVWPGDSNGRELSLDQQFWVGKQLKPHRQVYTPIPFGKRIVSPTT